MRPALPDWLNLRRHWMRRAPGSESRHFEGLEWIEVRNVLSYKPAPYALSPTAGKGEAAWHAIDWTHVLGIRFIVPGFPGLVLVFSDLALRLLGSQPFVPNRALDLILFYGFLLPVSLAFTFVATRQLTRKRCVRFDPSSDQIILRGSKLWMIRDEVRFAPRDAVLQIHPVRAFAGPFRRYWCVAIHTRDMFMTLAITFEEAEARRCANRFGDATPGLAVRDGPGIRAWVVTLRADAKRRARHLKHARN